MNDLRGDRIPLPGIDVSSGRDDAVRDLRTPDGGVLPGEPSADDAPPDPFDDRFPTIGESVLARSVVLRFPDLENLTESERPEKLEFFIAAGARMRGELADLRLRASFALKSAQNEWDQMTGFEVNRRRGSDKTKASDEFAKTKTNPTLARLIQDARWVVERCTEEMKRHDADFDAASRAYTILSGG